MRMHYRTHYDILGVKEDASQEEIRLSYRSAILNSHPDKLRKASETTNSEPGGRFLEIQKAWQILGDLKSRKIYDRELVVSRQEDEVIADEVEVDDLMVEETSTGDVVELLHQCRCGDYYSIDSLELGEMGFQLLKEGNKISIQAPKTASIVLPCGSCSLKIRLFIDQDDMGSKAS